MIDTLIIDNLDNSRSDLDIVSQIWDKIDELVSNIQDGNMSYDNIIDILIKIAILFFILLILFILMLGLLSIIKNLWIKAKINYISKMQNTINSLKLEKILASLLNYNTVILKTKTIANTMLDISNKFMQLKEFFDLIKQLSLRSNKPNIAFFDTNIIVNMLNLLALVLNALDILGFILMSLL